ncbi:hypothetical protein GW17_00028565 [Ensete ventricosum]|nr:hypothetical protein GW17_00028565 [Ensete ventricosum]
MRSCRSGPGDVELSLDDKANLKGGSVRTLAESSPSRLSRVLRLCLVGQPRADISGKARTARYVPVWQLTALAAREQLFSPRGETERLPHGERDRGDVPYWYRQNIGTPVWTGT